MSAETPVFSSRAVFWLIAIGILSFAGAAFVFVFGERIEPGRSAGPHAFSTSAIGHQGLVRTLRRLGVPVVVSRNASAEKASQDALLVVTEPPGGDEARLDELLGAPTVLLVLPKWRGAAHALRPGWVSSIELRPREEVEALLRQALPDAAVRRARGTVAFDRRRFDIAPTLDAPQLLVSDHVTPIVASDEGVLIGELDLGVQTLWVLSDPDLLSNRGLGRGDNAVLAVRMIEALRPPDGAVIFDATLHGFQRTQSVWREAFTFPFVLVTVQLVATVVVLMWAGTGRFGAPVPAERALAPGKTGLIDNTASLFQGGDRGREIMSRYLTAMTRDVARQLHAPPGLDEAEQIAWFDRVGRARGVQAPFGSLNRTIRDLIDRGYVADMRLVQAARQLYQWKREMTHGAGSHPVRQPGSQGAGRQDDRRSRSGA